MVRLRLDVRLRCSSVCDLIDRNCFRIVKISSTLVELTDVVVGLDGVRSYPVRALFSLDTFTGRLLKCAFLERKLANGIPREAYGLPG
jgi:hypothetical protein